MYFDPAIWSVLITKAFSMNTNLEPFEKIIGSVEITCDHDFLLPFTNKLIFYGKMLIFVSLSLLILVVKFSNNPPTGQEQTSVMRTLNEVKLCLARNT